MNKQLAKKYLENKGKRKPRKKREIKPHNEQSFRTMTGLFGLGLLAIIQPEKAKEIMSDLLKTDSILEAETIE